MALRFELYISFRSRLLAKVSLGNICRSLLAEAAFRAEVVRIGLDVEVDSAGTGDWHVANHLIGALKPWQAIRHRHQLASRTTGDTP